MLAASRMRRRVLSAVFVAASGLLLLTAPDMPPGTRWKALLVGPAFLMLGTVGLVYPKAVPDPRPAAGVVGAMSEVGAPGLVLGSCVFAIGLGIGAWVAFAG